MTLDLHKLEIFVTIARLGSFTRAADHLYMTQPTISQQLAALEGQIGTALIERDTRQMRLTPAGDVLLPLAEKLLAGAQEAIESARAAAGLADRTLRLGVGHTLATYLLPTLLSRYQTQFPDHTVRITVGNTAELLTLVAARETELALVGLPADHPDILATSFRDDRLLVIVAPGDAWAGRSDVAIEEVRQRTLLTREPGSALHTAVERLLGPSIRSDHAVILLGETEAIKRSVEVGIGIALIQGIAIEREVAAGNLCALRLRDVDDRRTYAYVQRQRHDLSTAAAHFVTLLNS
jgi:DNA-binding transcriptional LysR family regulator